MPAYKASIVSPSIRRTLVVAIPLLASLASKCEAPCEAKSPTFTQLKRRTPTRRTSRSCALGSKRTRRWFVGLAAETKAAR